MHPRSLTRFIATALVAATFAAGAVKADEVTDLLKKAESAYESGNYSEAISSLDYAGQLIRQKKGEALTKLLPDAPSGWTAEEATSEAASGSMFGGMVAVERRFTKDQAAVAVKITTDSPLLSSFLGMFTNPLLVTGSGAKLETIKGQKAVVKYDASAKSGDINIVVDGKLLVTVEGTEVTRDQLTAFANAVDYKKVSGVQ
jgi:hypothetical protein